MQVGSQSMADRYTYVPSIGLFIAIIWGMDYLLRNSQFLRKVVIGIACIFIISFIKKTHKQASVWKNTITLFEHALQVTENNDIAHANLGYQLQEMGKLDESVKHLKRAIEIYPGNGKNYNNLGMVYGKKNQLDKAKPLIQKAIELDPGNYKAYHNLGNVLGKKGHLDDAIENFKKAVELNPYFTDSMYNLGIAYMMQSKAIEAQKAFRRILELSPEYPGARKMLQDAVNMVK